MLSKESLLIVGCEQDEQGYWMPDKLEEKLAKATELLRGIGKVCYSVDPCPDATILHMINKSGLLKE